MTGGQPSESHSEHGLGYTKIMSPKTDGGEGASIGVVVIGETPYAEMLGDREDLSLAKETSTH